MAYDAAVKTHVDQALIDVYVAGCLKPRGTWRSWDASRLEQRQMESRVVDAAFPRMKGFLAAMNVEPYVSAPIASDANWSEYVESLPRLGGTPGNDHACEVQDACWENGGGLKGLAFRPKL